MALHAATVNAWVLNCRSWWRGTWCSES